jgi:hypothetical protein
MPPAAANPAKIAAGDASSPREPDLRRGAGDEIFLSVTRQSSSAA